MRRFAAGERIHTENSCKYTVEDFAALLVAAGFAPPRHWTDPQGWFAVFSADAALTAAQVRAAPQCSARNLTTRSRDAAPGSGIAADVDALPGMRAVRHVLPDAQRQRRVEAVPGAR